MTLNALDKFADSDWNLLVGEIYESALHPERWGDTLLSVGRPLNAHAAQMVVVANDVSNCFDDIIVGLDVPVVQREFEDLIDRGLHVRASHGSRIPELTTITDHVHTSDSEMKRHPFYQEHAYPHDIPYYAATVVSKSEDRFIASVILRSGKFGHFGKKEVSYLNSLGPHIRRSLELSFRLPAKGLIDGITSTIEHLHCGGIIVDSQARIVAINPKASHILCDADGLCEQSRCLHLWDHKASDSLRQELQIALGYRSSAVARGSGNVRVKRTSGKSPYSLFVMPVKRQRVDLFRQRHAIILIIDPEEDYILPEGFLRESFDLTPAESGVTKLLLSGHSTSEIARLRGSKISTIRSQLKSMFEKTGCTHQSELVSKLARASSVQPLVTRSD